MEVTEAFLFSRESLGENLQACTQEGSEGHTQNSIMLAFFKSIVGMKKGVKMGKFRSFFKGETMRFWIEFNAS